MYGRPRGDYYPPFALPVWTIDLSNTFGYSLSLTSCWPVTPIAEVLFFSGWVVLTYCSIGLFLTVHKNSKTLIRSSRLILADRNLKKLQPFKSSFVFLVYNLLCFKWAPDQDVSWPTNDRKFNCAFDKVKQLETHIEGPGTRLYVVRGKTTDKSDSIVRSGTADVVWSGT